MKTAPLRDEGGKSRSEEDMFCGRLAWLHHIIQSEGMIREKWKLGIYCIFYQLFNVESVAQNKKNI